jgi:hypothetical protein
MTIADWIMIFAVLLGPVVAVQLTRYLDDKKEIRERKLWIFKTLMASRAATLSPFHVEALNRIDLEFDPNNKSEKEVINAWKAYLNLLSDKDIPPEQWGVRRADFLVDLLHKMANVLNYEFDRTTIRQSSYFPRSHSELEEDQTAIRKGMKDLIEGKKVIPMYVTNFPAPPDEAPKS